MAIIKEYGCKKCGPFEALAAVCPRCGKAETVTRQFRTAPGINRGATVRGSARGIDRILAREFENQGIVNFRNDGGIGRPEFKRRHIARINEQFPGTYATGFGGAQTPPITAGFVDGGMTNPQLPGGLSIQNLQVDGRPFNIPDSQHILAPANGRIGGPPNELLKRTQVAGRTDNKGRQIT